MGWSNKVREEDFSPEVKYLLKSLKFEELIPKTRDAVNLFFLNVKANPDGGANEAALLRPVYRAITKKEDVTDKGGLRAIVALLSSQALPLQMQAAAALSSLALDGEEVVMEAMRGLNVHIIATKMIPTPGISEQLLLKLLSILANMARNEGCQTPITRIRAITAIVGLLEGPPKPLPVQRFCHQFFSALAANKEALPALAKEDGLTQAVKAILHNDDQIRFLGLKVVAGFSRQEKGRAQLLTHHAVKSLNQLLANQNQVLDDTSMTSALSSLGHISESEEGQQQIAEVGVLATVTALMYSSNAVVAEKALKALLNFSTYDGNKEELVTMSGVVLSLYSRALKGDSAVRTLSMSILNNLASSEKFLGEIGTNAIVELVNIMPPAPVIVQRVIARIVKSTAMHDAVKDALIENACISIFTGIMNNTKDDFVLAEIIDAFALLTRHDRIRKVMIACGYTTKIVSLFGSHLFTRLQLPIIAVIANFTLEEAGVQAVLRLNGAFTLFCRFALIHENELVQTHALMAVSNLLVNETYREELVNAGVLEAATYLMFSKDMDLQIGAIRVVAKVAQSSRFHQHLQEEDIIEHLKELKLHPNFKIPGNSRLVTAFKELVFALKSAGSALPTVPNSEKTYFWIKAQLGDFTRFLKVPIDITIEAITKLARASFGFKEGHKISLMFRDSGYPVVVHSSDELLLFFMNYQGGKRVLLQIFDGDVPDETVEEINFKPAPPPPPPPPPGMLAKMPGLLNPFVSPAYIKTHNLGETRMAVKPTNNLLPETLMSDILSAVKNRAEGKQNLTPAGSRNVNQLPPGSGDASSSSLPVYAGQALLRPTGSETAGGREFFRDVGKWYRGVQQVFLLHPIMIKVVFDMVDSRSDHKSFSRCFDTAIADLPHMLPHMKGQIMGNDEFAECLLKIGFNVKSSKVTGADGKEQTKYELIVRPSSLPPELLLKAIMLSTGAAGI